MSDCFGLAYSQNNEETSINKVMRVLEDKLKFSVIKEFMDIKF